MPVLWRERGVDAALTAYGMTKSSGFGSVIKDILVGNPTKYLNQLRKGTLFTRKGMIAEMADPRVKTGPSWARGPRTALNTALLYGMPAYSVYEAAKTDPESRGSTVGSTLGSIAGSTVAAPLGILGSLGGGALGGALGESVGRLMNKHPPPQDRVSR